MATHLRLQKHLRVKLPDMSSPPSTTPRFDFYPKSTLSIEYQTSSITHDNQSFACDSQRPCIGVWDDLKLLDDGGDTQILRKKLAVRFLVVKPPFYLTETWRWHVGLLSQKDRDHVLLHQHVQECPARLGICGTHLKSSIQDIVDEVAPIKKAPLWGWGPIHSKVTSLD